jgi:type IX secretion system PorP/SprF family membrane protein
MDLGFGAFYNIPGKFYAGLSSTHISAQEIKGANDLRFKVSRHIYFMTGYTIQLNAWSKVTPNILYKTDIAASSADLNLTYLWSDMIWVGGTYRLDNAAAVLIGYQGKAMAGNTLSYKIGYSYDFAATSALSKYNSGSHEIILGACFTPKIKKTTTYGDPRFLD